MHYCLEFSQLTPRVIISGYANTVNLPNMVCASWLWRISRGIGANHFNAETHSKQKFQIAMTRLRNKYHTLGGRTRRVNLHRCWSHEWKSSILPFCQIRVIWLFQIRWNPALRPPRLYKTTSLLRPYSFNPNVKTIESFYYFEDPVNATTSLLRSGFYSPTVVALTGLYLI